MRTDAALPRQQLLDGLDYLGEQRDGAAAHHARTRSCNDARPRRDAPSIRHDFGAYCLSAEP